MINSMTGYGQAEAALSKDGQAVSCEIRTVNHRFCEVACKLPRVLFAYEDEVRGIVRDNLVRGYITVKIAMDESEEALGALQIDYDYARNYQKVLKRLKRELGLSGDVDVSLFIQRPGIFKEAKGEPPTDKTWQTIKRTIGSALNDVKKSRRKEGKRLLSDMKKRTNRIATIIDKIERKSPRTVREKKKSLLKKISGLGDLGYGELRIEEEVTIFAQRSDVVEECVRLRSHLRSFSNTFDADRAVGRRLVFLLQEMNREANTIASKAQDAQISQHVVSIKEELERLREQAENVV